MRKNSKIIKTISFALVLIFTRHTIATTVPIDPSVIARRPAGPTKQSQNLIPQLRANVNDTTREPELQFALRTAVNSIRRRGGEALHGLTSWLGPKSAKYRLFKNDFQLALVGPQFAGAGDFTIRCLEQDVTGAVPKEIGLLAETTVNDITVRLLGKTKEGAAGAVGNVIKIGFFRTEFPVYQEREFVSGEALLEKVIEQEFGDKDEIVIVEIGPGDKPLQIDLCRELYEHLLSKAPGKKIRYIGVDPALGPESFYSIAVDRRHYLELSEKRENAEKIKQRLSRSKFCLIKGHAQKLIPYLKGKADIVFSKYPYDKDYATYFQISKTLVKDSGVVVALLDECLFDVFADFIKHVFTHSPPYAEDGVLLKEQLIKEDSKKLSELISHGALPQEPNFTVQATHVGKDYVAFLGKPRAGAVEKNALHPDWWLENLPKGVGIPTEWRDKDIKSLTLDSIEGFLHELAGKAQDENVLRFILNLAEGKIDDTRSVRRHALKMLISFDRPVLFDKPETIRTLKRIVQNEGREFSELALFALCQIPGFKDISFLDRIKSEKDSKDVFIGFLKRLLAIKKGVSAVPVVEKVPNALVINGEDIIRSFLNEAAFIKRSLTPLEKINVKNTGSIPAGIPEEIFIHQDIAHKTLHIFNLMQQNPLVKRLAGLIEEIGFSRILTPEGLSKDSIWPKDASLLIATRFGPVPYPSKGLGIKGGELVSGYGERGAFVIISEEVIRAPDSAHNPQDLLREMIPGVNIYKLPSGFLTLKHKGKFYLRGTSHIDVVMGSVPADTARYKPVVLIDPQYHQIIKGLSDYRRLIEDEGARFVDVPEEERYLNPANFATLPGNKIILPYAPKTRNALIQAGLNPDNIFMLPEGYNKFLPILHVLGGSIGCLVGQHIAPAGAVEYALFGEVLKLADIVLDDKQIDSIERHLSGDNLTPKTELGKNLRGSEGVLKVDIRDREVNIYSASSLVRFHKADYIPVEHMGLRDRVTSGEMTLKVYEGKFLAENKGEYILGISGSWHDTTAVLVKNGQIVAALEEERMTRVKHDTSYYPVNAVHRLLKEEGISLDDIAHIAIGWNYNLHLPTPHSRAPDDVFFEKMDKQFAREKGISPDNVMRRNVPERNKERFTIERLRIFLEELRDYYGAERIPRVSFVRHHLAHAAAGYYTSGFKGPVLVVSLDGYGDTETGTVWIGDDQKMEEIAHFDLPNSLGWVYSAITEYIGFRPTFADGEVMGFAPYGEPRDDAEYKRVEELRRIFRDYLHFDLEKGSPVVNPENLYYGDMEMGKKRITSSFARKLEKLGIIPSKKSSKYIDPLLPEDRPYANLAFVLQETTENVVLDIVRYYLRENPKTKNIKKLALNGGFALNILANGKIISEGLVKSQDMFVQPAASDAGTALGAALVVAKEIYGENVGFEMTNAFLGPMYNDDDIQKALDEFGFIPGVDYEKVSRERLIEEAAQCIKSNEPIAWFQGRSELGPRALGARSILLNILDDVANNTANIIKGRQSWRPSASSIIEEAAKDYYIGIARSPFMIVAYSVVPNKKQLLVSGIHQYGKRMARPQTVDRESNPLYWDLLKKVGEQIGVPAVVNTSFNKHEPLVESPEEAINALKYMEHVKKLFIGNFILRKSDRIKPTIISLQDESSLQGILEQAVSTGDINDWDTLFVKISELYPRCHRIVVTFDCGDYGTKTINIPIAKELFEGSLSRVLLRYVSSTTYNYATGFGAKKIYIGSTSEKMSEPIFYLMRDCLKENFKRMDYFANFGERVEILHMSKKEIYKKSRVSKVSLTRPLPKEKRKGVYVGVDVGGNSIKGVVLKDNEVIKEASVDTTLDGGKDLKKLIMKLIADLTQGVKVSGIGVALPGVVDPASGTLLWLVNYEHKWKENISLSKADLKNEYDILNSMRDELKRGYDIDNVEVLNDASSFGIASLDLDSENRGVLIALGTGVGTARLEEGSMDMNRIEQSGGFVINVNEDSPFDKGCDVKGCLAAYASEKAVIAMSLELGLTGMLGAERLNARDVSQLLRDGPGIGFAEATRVYNSIAKSIASWMKLMHKMRGDTNFVLTGGITAGDAGQVLLRRIEQALRKNEEYAEISVSLSNIDRVYGGARGAALFAMSRSNLYSRDEGMYRAGAVEKKGTRPPVPSSDDFRSIKIKQPLRFKNVKIQQKRYSLSGNGFHPSQIFPVVKITINEKPYRVGNGFYLIITLADGKKIYWGGQHNLSYSFFFEHFKDRPERAKEILGRGGIVWRHLDAHYDFGHYLTEITGPYPKRYESVDWQKEIKFGFDSLTPADYLGYLVHTGIIRRLDLAYSLQRSPNSKVDKIRKEVLPARIRGLSLKRLAGEQNKGGVTDLDIDIIVGTDSDMTVEQAQENFKEMKPRLLAIAKDSEVNFFCTSSELSKHSYRAPLYINPHLAAAFVGELIGDLAKDAAGAVALERLASQEIARIAEEVSGLNKPFTADMGAERVCHLVVQDLIPDWQVGDVMELVKRSRDSWSPEKIEMLRLNAGAGAVDQINAKVISLENQGFTVTLAVHDKALLEGALPHVRAVAFSGKMEFNIVLVTARALVREDAQTLLRLYKVLLKQDYPGAVPRPGDTLSFVRFAQRLAWELPASTAIPIEDLDKIRDALLQFALSA